MIQKRRTILSALSLAAGVLLLAVSGTARAQVRVGSTITAIPGDGIAKRFPDVAFDDANNAYLVITGLSVVEARYVAPNGTPLGTAAKISTTTAGASRVACAPAINKCLIVWLQEPPVKRLRAEHSEQARRGREPLDALRLVESRERPGTSLRDRHVLEPRLLDAAGR